MLSVSYFERSIMKNLTKGSKGFNVSTVQKALNWDYGFKLVPDGDYGPGTVEAVKSWQGKVGLPVTGNVTIVDYTNMKASADRFLDDETIEKGALRIGVKASAMKAFAEVESGGSGFLPSKRPIILFERHVFYKEVVALLGEKTAKEWQAKYPNICHPVWDSSVYKGKEGEWPRLEQAKQLSNSCALKATSWGLFQIMGNNFSYAGYTNVEDFVRDMHVSEDLQFDAVCSFIQKYPNRNAGTGLNLLQSIKALDWAGAARIYNGPGYAKNNYDKKLQAAERKYANM